MLIICTLPDDGVVFEAKTPYIAKETQVKSFTTFILYTNYPNTHINLLFIATLHADFTTKTYQVT